MKSSKRYIIMGLLLFMLFACSRTTFVTQSFYKIFPVEVEKATIPPEGYSLVYVNHLGRNNYSYSSNTEQINYLFDVLYNAYSQGALTSKGEALKNALSANLAFMQGRKGGASAIETDWQRASAQEMQADYPGAFDKSICLIASNDLRAMQSMVAFASVLLNTPVASRMHIMAQGDVDPLLGFYKLSDQFITYQNNVMSSMAPSYNFDPNELLEQLFTDDFLQSMPNGYTFCTGLYDVYKQSEQPGTLVALPSLKQKGVFELLDARSNDLKYKIYGPDPKADGLNSEISYPLLSDFIATVDGALESDTLSGVFRFASEEVFAPLLVLMEVASPAQGATAPLETPWNYAAWVPTGADIKWIVYKNNANDVLVKMEVNGKETNFPLQSDVAPFYRWADVKTYYQNKLNGLGIDDHLPLELQIKSYRL